MNQPYPGSAEHVAYFPRWLHRLWWGFMAVVLIATAWLGWFDWHQTRDREIADLRTLAAAVAEGTQGLLNGTQVSLALLGQQMAVDHRYPPSGPAPRLYREA
ncbi:hypothetical protein A5904_05685 [Acidithiobacillus caldus]|uniref:hypothetical protein n=1 Tax=Acidithiobacillus caldus TaxID=33059 RepID=UPI0007D9A387|nr:hypothetical protein [Acidithiobacillus caldus]AUW32520.1 hypothetical protein A5904_05685 [Acidithiobacillus caldus]